MLSHPSHCLLRATQLNGAFATSWTQSPNRVQTESKPGNEIDSNSKLIDHNTADPTMASSLRVRMQGSLWWFWWRTLLH